MQTHTASVIGQEEAQEILEPWLPIMREKFHLAWEWVQAILDEDQDRRATLDPSTVSAMVYNRFTRLIIPEFVGKPGIRIKQTGRMIRVRIQDKIWLRFKRLDRRLRSGNVRTKTQRAIYNQQPTLIDVTDRATAVTFGYVADIGEVRGLYLTCPKNFRELNWLIVIDDSAAAMPLFPAVPVPTSTPMAVPSIMPLIKPAQTEKT